jgi:hypothetical protein
MDTSYIANGSAFMLGCGYALLKGAPLRTDMLSMGCSAMNADTDRRL